MFRKDVYFRGGGSGLTCDPGQEYDAGLCYQPCASGYNDRGPFCWGSCPEGSQDLGGTCYVATSIITKY